MIDPEMLSFGDSVPVAADSNLIEHVADSPRIGFVLLEKCRRRVWLPEIVQNACNPQTCTDQFVDMYSNDDAEVFGGGLGRSWIESGRWCRLVSRVPVRQRVQGETRRWTCRTNSFARRPIILPQSVSCFFEMFRMIKKWPHSFEQQPEFLKWILC